MVNVKGEYWKKTKVLSILRSDVYIKIEPCGYADVKSIIFGTSEVWHCWFSAYKFCVDV